MSVVYNGAHSITFIEALDSDTDSTPTAYSSYKRSWRDFHLVPEKRPSVNPPSPSLNLIDVPGTNKRIDMTDYMPGGLKFGRRQGEWQFILDHDLWDNWHVAKKTIEDTINGKRLYCILEDDFNTAYRGRFRVQGWQSGPNYSSIVISYDLEYKKYTNAFNVLDDVTENKMLSSWSEVDKMIQDGSYKKNIAIGDSAYLYLPGEYADYVDVAAIDTDVDNHDQSFAVTWIAQKLLNNKYQMKDKDTISLDIDPGPYPEVASWYPSSIYYRLNETIFSLFPDRIQHMMRLTEKYSYSYYKNYYNDPLDNARLIANDRDYSKVWIPSYREVFGGTYKESIGPVYSDYFNNNAKRKKYDPSTGESIEWYLRSAYGKNYFCIVQKNSANVTYRYPVSMTYKEGILIGFCTGAST